MKIGFITINIRVRLNTTNIGTIESLCFIKTLSNIGDVTLFDRPYKDEESDYYNCVNILDVEPILETINDFHCLFVLPGSIDFFSGYDNLVEGDPDRVYAKINKYKLLSKFNGQIFVLQPDLHIQILEDMTKRSTQYHLNPEDIRIDGNNITYLTQAINTESVKSLVNKSINNIKCDNFIHVPLYKSLCLYNTYSYLISYDRNIDFSYWGTLRPDRMKDIEKYLMDKRVNFYTKIKSSEKFEKNSNHKEYPTWHNFLKFNDVHDNMKQTMSTLILTCNIYKNCGMFTFKIFEVMYAGVIGFIDESTDPTHLIHPNNSFFYVNSKDELFEKVEKIKINHKLRLQLQNEQYDIIESFTLNDYVNDIKNCINKT